MQRKTKFLLMTKKQNKMILDDYEYEILEAYENGKLKPSKSNIDYQAIAKNTMEKIEKSTLEYQKTIFPR